MAQFLTAINSPEAGGPKTYTCMLCGGLGQVPGVFIPRPSQRRLFPMEGGEAYAIGYLLCRACDVRPTMARDVKAKLLDEFSRVCLEEQALRN